MDNPNNFQEINSLFEACENEQVEIVKELLKQGADPNFQNEHGQTALHVCNEIETIQILLSYGANPNITDCNGDTPLHHASITVRVDKMRQLLNQGADPNALNNTKSTALHIVMCNYTKNDKHLVLDAIKLLIEFHAEIDIQNKSGETPLYLGLKAKPANEQKLEIIHELLKLGANPNVKTYYGTTSLREIVLTLQNIDLLSLMILYGARVDIAQPNGVTLLHQAATKLNTEMIRKLLENGANPNALTRLNFSPLCSVFTEFSEDEKPIVEAIDELVKHGADINFQDSDRWTALHYAISVNYRAVANVLLRLGSNQNIRDKYGNSAIEMALEIKCRPMYFAKNLFYNIQNL